VKRTVELFLGSVIFFLCMAVIFR